MKRYGAMLLACLAVVGPIELLAWQHSFASQAAPIELFDSRALGNSKQHLLKSDGVSDSLRIDQSAVLKALQIDRPIIAVPNSAGETQAFQLSPSRVMHPKLASRYPMIRSFRGTNLETGESGQFVISEFGVFGTFLSDGQQMKLRPTSSRSTLHEAVLSSESSQQSQCQLTTQQKLGGPAATNQSTEFGDQVLTLRLAIATTGEFGVQNGSTVASVLARVVAEVAQINEVFERDLAVKFELVANNDQILFTNPQTDPFSSNDSFVLLGQNQTAIDARIGVANYDIGHLFFSGIYGRASLESACTSAKAQAVSGIQLAFSETILHEMGHQFAALHTFNGGTSSCGIPFSHNPESAVEPGSGSTLMSYAGTCASENIVPTYDRYFHGHSLEQMASFVSTLSCGVRTSSGNALPIANAGPDAVIPQLTPFELEGSATDTDPSDTLTFTWEQIDTGVQTMSRIEFRDDGQSPIFRSFPPSVSATRTLPQFSDIADDRLTYGERYPATQRDLNFRFTARDQNGGISFDDKVISVAAAGPFAVTEPSDTSTWRGGQVAAVQWDVAGTPAAPINCAAVDIQLSANTDSDFEFDLAMNTANDGSESITVPALQTSDARVKISCTSQPFFSLSSAFEATDPNVPLITGQVALVTDEETALTLGVADFMIDDANNTMADFTLTVISGDDYEVAGETITPTENFAGELTVPVQVSDGQNQSNIFSALVTVININDVPIANDDTFTVGQGVDGANLFALANDSDPDDGDTLSVGTLGTPSAGGAVVANANGREIVYTPAAGFSGTETFTYTASDGTTESNVATVTVTVTPTPTAPPPNPGGGGGGGGGGSLGTWLLLLLLSCGICRSGSPKARLVRH